MRRCLFVIVFLVAARLPAAVHFWTGAVSERLSDPANWVNGVPSAGADVELPSNVARRAIVNDVDGLALRYLVFSGGGYTLSGKPIHVRGHIGDTSRAAEGNRIDADVVLDADVTVASAAGGGLTFAGAISGSGGITTESNGLITFAGDASNSYGGATRVVSGTLRLAKTSGAAAIPHALVAGSAGIVDLGGRAAVLGPITIAGGVLRNGAVVLAGDVVVTSPNAYASLADVVLTETRAITVASAAGGVFLGNVAGPPDARLLLNGGANNVNTRSAVTADAAHLTGVTGALTSRGATLGDVEVNGDLQLDRASTVDGVLRAHGAVDLGDATLAYRASPSPGKQITLIENLGGAPVRGTFHGLGEGAVTADGRYRVSYRGGATSLDVVLTDVTRAVTRLDIRVPSGQVLQAGQSAVVAVTLSSAGGLPAPAGEIVLRRGGEVVGRGAVSGSGTASIATAPLRAGTTSLSIDYSGDAVYAPVSTSLALQVWNPLPKIDSVSPDTIVAGVPTELTFHGSNFIEPVTVQMVTGRQFYSEVTKYRATLVSPTEVRAVVVATAFADLGSVFVTVANDKNFFDPAFNGSGASVTVQKPPEAISLTLDGGGATASTTPEATTYWLRSGVALDAVVKAGSTGLARWSVSTFNPLFAVVDSNGAAAVAPPNVRRKNASSLLQRGPDGALSRLEIDGFDGSNAHALWVRPAAGAWRIDLSPSSLYRYGVGTVAELFAADARPVGASPPPPSAFAPGDVVVVLIDGYENESMLLRVPPQLPSVVPAIALRPVAGTVDQGSAAAYVVRRLHESASALTVRYSVRGNGQPSCVVPASGTLTFAPGEIEKRIAVQTIDDGFAGAETITVQAEADGGEVVHDLSNSIFVYDDPLPVLSVDDVSVIEGDSGTRTATLHARLSRPLRFGVQFSDGVLFEAGQTQQTIAVPYQANTTPEPDRTIAVTVSERYYNRFDFAKPTGVVTIVDDDAPRLTIDDGAATFTVSLTRAAAEPVTVRYATADLSARAGSDYRAAAGTLTFAPGETAKTIEIALLGAATAPKRFAVILSEGTVPFAKAAGIGVIAGNTPPSPVVAIDDAGGIEGTTLAVPLRLSAPSPVPVTVRYATYDGTATAPDDYAAAGGSVTFAPGEVRKTIAVATVYRAAADPPKTFFIVLSDAGAPIERSTAVCTIVDLPPRHRAAGH